jgi:hypothetical protein
LVFSFGLPLCKLLQKEKNDLREAVSFAEDIIIVLKNIRLNCGPEFHKHCPHKFAIQIYFDPPPPMKHSQLRHCISSKTIMIDALNYTYILIKESSTSTLNKRCTR